MHRLHAFFALVALPSILSACGGELRDDAARGRAPADRSSLVLSAGQSPAGRSPSAGEGPAVSAEGAVDVEVAVGAEAPARIACDADLLPKVHVEQRGTTTRVYTDPGFSVGAHGPCTVYLGLASLCRLDASGSGDVRVRGLAPDLAAAATTGSGDVTIDDMGASSLSLSATGSGNVTVSHAAPSALSVDVTGSGNVRVTGTADRARLALSGSGDVDARALRVQSAQVTVTGSGDVAIHASQKVSVSVSGSGDVKIAGQPADRRVSQLGSGSIDFE